MDQWMRAGVQQLRDDVAARIDTGTHLRRVRELADPHDIALEVGHGAAACRDWG
jgi:hypothetical protein